MNTTYFDGKQIVIDPTDVWGMIKLMDRADEFNVPWAGKNENGEHIQVSVNKDNITVETFQHNNWTRENIYYRDGSAEELFHR